ncbi:MAG: ribosome small subunit-dependent GTPase A [Burkholderiaceae bacterium]|nr:MAG: ribosome small subunit-dependent GTPase A [Burkholderiaceae bacterium]
MRAQIIAGHGRHYLADIGSAQPLQAYPRSKRSEYAVGDWVQLERASGDQASIVALEERQSLLYRSDAYRQKLLAANLTQLIVVLATEPHFSEDFLGRALTAAGAIDLPVQIVLNKTDLATHLASSQQRLAYYAALGYPVHALSAKTEPAQVRDLLQPLITRHITLLIGQSGMGKSSLLNLLVPDAQALTREISTALGSGKHTTTTTRLYRLNGDTALVDSPGFQEFGLHHLSKSQLEHAFADFTPYRGACKFHNCRHASEPGCAIAQAVKEGRITPQRQQLFGLLLHESEVQLT